MIENTESTQRQYALKKRALALGWPEQRLVVIDTDLGQSGTQATDRQGFQKLVAEVGMGRAGIVLGLEVSRLALDTDLRAAWSDPTTPHREKKRMLALLVEDVTLIKHASAMGRLLLDGETNEERIVAGRDVVREASPMVPVAWIWMWPASRASSGRPPSPYG